ncbi:hypothetical protein N0V83_002823 [Neocucurbitaria cava]|uniref:Uncharacterized protein n=1 Tax=Neocucurbitaria cava TaxID=798079 RepID=A0A9W8YCX8_9PLEO|nr:hypothetical protein N0V83_002823 [Neocucurbitaria cava]
MLPQLGQPIYSSRLEGLSNDPDRDAKSKEPDLVATEPENVPISKDVGVQGSVPGRLRPRSMYQYGPTRTERVTRTDDTPPSRSMLPPASASKPSEPKPAGLSRSRSLRRPGGAMQSAQPRETTVQARTQSVNTTGITRKETMKSDTGSERPKSLLVAPNSNLKTNIIPRDRTPHDTKVSTRIAHNRSTSIKARAEGLSGSARTATTARAEEPLVPQPRQRQPEQEEPKRIARPGLLNFTTTFHTTED